MSAIGRPALCLVHGGPAMAAADSLRVVIKGRVAHGSRPKASIDPIVIASSIVMKLQSIVARDILPSDVAVVTVGSLCAAAGVEEAPLIESIGRFPGLSMRRPGLSAMPRPWRMTASTGRFRRTIRRSSRPSLGVRSRLIRRAAAGVWGMDAEGLTSTWSASRSKLLQVPTLRERGRRV